MRRAALLALVALLACKKSTARPPTDAAAIDAGPADAGPTIEELHAEWTAEVASDLRKLDAFLARASEVRVVRTWQKDRRGAGDVLERCGWQTLDKSQVEGLRAALRTLSWQEPPACVFVPSLRFDIVTPERTLRMEVCLGCRDLKAEDIVQFHFGTREEGALETWVRNMFPKDETISDALVGAHSNANVTEEPPCSP
jgi:hypothetical protein